MGNISYKSWIPLIIQVHMDVRRAMGQQTFIECLGSWVSEDRCTFVLSLSRFF